MKKLIAYILVLMFAAAAVLVLLSVDAMACEETGIPLPKIEEGAEQLSGCAWFAVDTTRHIVGKWDAGAREEVFTATAEEAPFILGLLDNGIVRAKGELSYTEMGGWVLGLTRLETSVEIYAEYAGQVGVIVEDRTGEGMSAAAVIAATQWRTAGTIYHVFFLPDSPKAAVGVVRINGGRSSATLYAGEFEGVLCLGFVTGGMPCQPEEEPEPEATEEPEPQPTPEPVIIRETVVVKETVVRECVKQPVTVIQNNFQINYKSTVTNCQKVILSGGGCGGKSVHCVED